MNTGKYIVLEGAQGVGKTTIVDMLAHELERHGLTVQKMHEPDSRADATTQEIRRLTQDPSYPMNTRTEVLLYNAARSQSLEAVRTARDSGAIVLVDRSYLTTLAVQFYGRGDIADYQRMNDIIAFAVGDMWPDLTIVLDAPVDTLRERLQKRGERERFDNLDSAVLDRIRAGYLWEARQRNMPVVYADKGVLETFQEVWQHLEHLLRLQDTSTNEPVPIADLLAQSPAAQVLKQQYAAAPASELPSYFIPPTLPDDVQCDYCDDMERMVRAVQKLTTHLAQSLQQRVPGAVGAVQATEQARTILESIQPVACASESLRTLVSSVEYHQLPENILRTVPNLYSSENETIKLLTARPRNELDLVPAMLYEALDGSLRDIQTAAEIWPYEVKTTLLHSYLRGYPNGKALAGTQYVFECMTALSILNHLPESVLTNVNLQVLTPRYGYTTPPEVEAAGLADDYDAVFDLSLALHSTLQARGFTQEAQYATLLGHTQRWLLTCSFSEISALSTEQPLHKKLHASLAEVHPLLASAKTLDRAEHTQ